MPINRMSIKTNAKYSMQVARPNPMFIALCYLLLVFILSFLWNKLTNAEAISSAYLDLSVLMQNPDWLYSEGLQNKSLEVMKQVNELTLGWMTNPVNFLLAVMILLMQTVLGVGFRIYSMNVARTQPAGIGSLFDGFIMVGRIVVLTVIEGILVFLWSLLLVIPGIVASYRYRMAWFLLIDNPDMSPLECIRESKAMMRGRKSELFFLDLSFFGWNLLTALPNIFIPYLGTLFSIWVEPYTGVTYCNYYDALRTLQQGGDLGGMSYSPPPPGSIAGGAPQSPGSGGSRPDSGSDGGTGSFGGYTDGSSESGGFAPDDVNDNSTNSPGTDNAAGDNSADGDGADDEN